MDDVGVAGGTARGDRKGRHERGQRERPHRLRPQVADDPGAVSDAVVAKRRRRDDLHLHPLGTHVLHRIGDEPPRRIPREPGIRRRQHHDLHRGVRRNRRPKTIGTHSASMTNA